MAPSSREFFKNNKNLPAQGYTHNYTAEEAKALVKCNKSILEFSKYFYIINPDTGRQPIKLYKYQKKMLKALQSNDNNVILSSRQMGKALALDTLIPTPDGFKKMGDLVIGDIVYDENGNYCNVIGAWETLYNRDCYEIKFSTGETIIADGEHLWKVNQYTSARTTKELLKFIDNSKFTISRDNKKFNSDIEIISIKKTHTVPVRCISVDSPNSLFMCGETYIPTHNTTVMTIFALWIACFNSDKRIVIIANKQATAIEVLDRVRLAFENLPNWLKPSTDEWGKTEVKFGNGSKIEVSATSEDAIRGKSVNVLMIDEAAHIPNNIMNALWSAVIPVLSAAKTGKVCMVSTANGKYNKFYDIYTSAVAGEGEGDDWNPLRIDWYDHPDRDENWKKAQTKRLGSRMAFEQEFGNEFLDNGENAIDNELIDSFKEHAKNIVPVFEDNGEGTYEYKEFERYDESCFYAIGVDSAEGVGQHYSVAQILNVTNADNIIQVGVLRSNKLDVFNFAYHINRIARTWGTPPLLVENNNCGAQVVDFLVRQHQYPHIVSYIPKAGKLVVDPNRLGIQSHTNSKSVAINNMRYYINTKRSVVLNDLKTIDEMTTYVKGPNGTWKKRSGEGIYDDSLEALMWALFVFHSDVATQFYEVKETDAQGKITKLIPNYISYFSEDQRQTAGQRTKEMLMRKFGLYNEGDFEQYSRYGVMPSILGGSISDASSYDVEMNRMKLEGWELPDHMDPDSMNYAPPISDNPEFDGYWSDRTIVSSSYNKEGLLNNIKNR